MHIETLNTNQPLSTQEEHRLWHLETAIESGIESAERGLSKMARSLEEIRNDRLYRATHSTFAAYCQDRWKKSSRYINMLISAGETQDNLSSLGTWVPTQEKHLRQLSSLNPEQQAEAVIAVDVIASATPDRTPVTADFQKAAAAAKAKSPYEAIDNAIAQQETITVTDADHPLYGRSGFATERQGLAVKIEVEPGKTTALLVNQIAVGSEVAEPVKAIAPAPKQQPTNPAEGLQSAYDVLEMRMSVFTHYLRRTVQALKEVGRPEHQSLLAEVDKVLG